MIRVRDRPSSEVCVREQQLINKVKIAGYDLGLVVFLAVAAWKLLVR
jgi:hypothetical protein